MPRYLLFLGILAVAAALLQRTATAPTQVHDATGVTFRLVLERPADSVSVAGDFNGWQPGADPMRSADGGLTWTLTLSLPAGAHQYKFVINGSDWRTDPTAVQTVDDGNGNLNSVVWVDPAGAGARARRGDGRITGSAISHRPDDLRDRDPDGDRLYLTVRTRQDDVQTVALMVRRGARVAERTVNSFVSDGLFTYYRTEVPNAACDYAFRFRDGPTTRWLGPDGLSRTRPQRWFTFTPSRAKQLHPPDWLQDAVFYQVLPDRFANGDPSNDPQTGVPLDQTGRTDRFFGGDLQGITEHLGYIRDLGANTLYLNPIFTSVTHHKYDTDNYEHVDPHFGGDSALFDLSRAAHRDGIRMVLDGVFNHVGINFFAFKDLLQRQRQSEYVDWFTVHRYPVAVEQPPPYAAWWSIRYMPKLNHANPKVRRYLLRISGDWMRRARLDGWRLDAANEVSDIYWREFRANTKDINPRAALIGEIWTDPSHWLQGDMFDSTMDYPWRSAVLDWIAHRQVPPSRFDQRLKMMEASLPPEALHGMYNLLGSHDTPRIRNECGGDLRRVRLAYLFQMTSPGAPAIYYGDEIGMEGGRDPDNRRPMDWNPSQEGQRLHDYVRKLVALRRSLPELRRGDWQTLLTDDRQNVYAYARRCAGREAIVVINNGGAPASVEIPLPSASTGLRAVFDTESPDVPPSVVSTGSRIQLSLPPMSGRVLVGAYHSRTG